MALYCERYHENGILDNPYFSQFSVCEKFRTWSTWHQNCMSFYVTPFVMGILSNTLVILPEIYRISFCYILQKTHLPSTSDTHLTMRRGKSYYGGKGYYIVRFPPGKSYYIASFPGGKATMGERLLYNTGHVDISFYSHEQTKDYWLYILSRTFLHPSLYICSCNRT